MTLALFPEVILDTYQKNMVEKAFDLGMNVMAVYVSLNEHTMLKSVRAFLIDNNLKEIGEVIASFPPSEVIEDEEKFEGQCRLYSCDRITKPRSALYCE